MHQYARLIVPVIAGILIIGSACAQVFTVQVGTPPAAPEIIVSRTNVWRWHKGTNQPASGWQTNLDATLGATWLTGQGGFGYSTDTPAETNNCRTIVSDMINNYRTLYIRREFQITNAVDPSARLRLTVDYDDAFVAYLDGAEVFRTANVPGTAGVEPTNTALATSNHESSLGSSGLAPLVTDLGAVGSRLGLGTHYLSIIGLNGTLNSSDLIIVPDLAVVPVASGAVPNNGIYALASTNQILLTGSNTVAGTTRVTVNGDDAAFSPGTGTWTNNVTLAPGFNRLYIAALDASGNLLSNITQDVVYEAAPLNVSGTLGGNTSWTNTSEVVRITSTVTVPNGVTLTIGPGVVVIVSQGASLLAGAGGIIDVQGTDAAKVHFLPATANVWNELAADGAASFLTIRHAEINRGAVKWRNGATGLMEDTYMHDYKNGSTPIAGCTSALSVTVRRSHFRTYHETLWGNTLMLIEDSLFEFADNASSDALDFDGAKEGSVIRRTTFRNGPQSNTDAIDIGPFAGTVGSTNTIIESSIMHDFPNDKGVSIGEGCYGIVVRNCVIWKTESGIGVKDSPGGRPPCTAIIYGNTITDSEFGIRCYNKSNPASAFEGGQVTNSYHNILYGNLTNVALLNGGTMVAEYSDIGGGFPGTGNIDADPLWVNAVARDYRLQAGSPALGAGLGGTNLGVPFPVGGIPIWVSHLAAISSGTNFVALNWRENADNEDGFLVQRSTDKISWSNIGNTGTGVTNFTDTTGLVGVKYYYRVRATNDVGLSPVSNPASGQRQAPVQMVGGTISSSTLWAAGTTIIVTSSVTVAASATLTIEPCVRVLFNQATRLTVNGQLVAEGAPDCRIVFTTNAAAGATSWDRIDLFNAASTHRMSYCDVNRSTGNIDADNTAFIGRNIWWTNTTSQLLDLVGTSVELHDCYIPGGAGIEPVHFSNMPANGYALIKNNIFGAPQGYNDSLDFTGGNRPGPIVRFIDNVFLGAVDDVMDLDATDAHIEGNIFLNIRQDAVRASTANAIATGEGTGDSEVVIVRNIFYNCDHALLLKDAGSAVFENNTVVTIQTNQFSASPAAYFQFGEPHRSVPGGRGVLMNGNIMWDLRSTIPFFAFTNGVMFMVANDNIIQGTNMNFGGNSTNDPMFVNWQTPLTYLNIRSNLALLPGSPAIGTGPNGLDRGALVPAGPSISGEPPTFTTNTSATLKIAGPGIYSYRWKLNNGPWSADVQLTNNFLITATMFSNAVPITLTGLTNGTYTVSVIGKDSAGFWQDTNNPTVSRTWTVGDGDSDADGIPDSYENQYPLALDANDPDDAGEDYDGDGMTNLEEYLAGTNPESAASRLWLQTVPSGGSLIFSFAALSNHSYTVEHRASLSTGSWLRLLDFAAAPTNRVVEITNAAADPIRFFRVVTPQVP
jgi:hypothetical protein